MKKSERKSWEPKLISNSVELLRRMSEEFPEYLEKIRKAEPPEVLNQLRREHFNWLPFYEPTFSQDQEVFEKVVPHLIRMDLAGKKIRPDIREVWAARFAHLFVLNNLPHPFQLFQRIQKADREALLDFAKVDKSILATGLAQPFICRAQLAGDMDFFEKLAKSLAFDPRALRRGNVKLYYLLLNISGLAIKKLSMPEICDILETVCQFEFEDVETVRKFWNRHGLHRYSRAK